MADAPPLEIEMSYDPEIGQSGHGGEEPDTRWVQVRIEKQKIKPNSATVGPPEESPDALCPIRIKGGSQNQVGNTIEFRAELEEEKIKSRFGTVEAAANQEHPILIQAQVDDHRTKPRFAKRSAVVRINLNRIHWKWTPLRRDDKGVVTDDGPTQPANTGIEVEVDGTDTHGFRLELQREERQQDGNYKPVDSDFVHFLSPDHKLNDMSVLELVPRPWDLAEGESQQEITTFWWTQNLAPDNPIRTKLPIDTTIRVRAYLDHSIKRHVEGQRPVTNPPDIGPLAIREIPLRLGLRIWKARVRTPDPKNPPILLEADQPWEEGFEVEVEILDDSKPDDIHYLKNEELNWKLLPGPDGQLSGGVTDSTGQGRPSGVWKTDDSGRFKFVFCPKEQNSLFLYQKTGTAYRAEFELRRKGKSEDKPGPKIRSAVKPGDEQAPSFSLDWAPKYDLGVFKLPFFIDPNQELDLEPEPDEEKAVPVTLTLAPEETEPYRAIFRTGGTVNLRPEVPWTDSDGNKLEFTLQRHRFVVGDLALGSKRKVLRVGPGSDSVWPCTVIIPSQPGDHAAEQPVTIHPEIPLHPEIVERFRVINEKSTKLDSTVASSGGLTEKSKLADWTNRFHDHGLKFGEQAVRYFCESPSEILCTNGKGIRAGLGAMAGFFDQATAAWDLLGDAIGLHRQIYKRFEDTLINFYFDVFGWDPIKKKLEPLRTAIEGLPGGKYLLDLLFPDRIVAHGYDWVQTQVLKSRLVAWVGTSLQVLAQKNEEAIAKTEEAIVAAERASEEASRGFDREAQKCGDHAANLQQEVDAFIQTAQTVQNQAQQLRASGVSGQALQTQNQSFLAQLNAAWARVLETRTRWRASLGSAIDHFKAGASAASQKTAASLEKELQNQNKGFLDTVSKEYSEILDKEDLEAEKLKEFMDGLTKGPDRGQGLAARSEATAALHDSLASGNATVVDLVNQYDQTWRGLAQRYEALSGKPLGTGVPGPNVGDEVSSYLERQVAPEVQKAQAETASAKENANDLVGRVNDITGRRFDYILNYWLSFFKVLEDRMEDAESQADMPLQAQMDEFLSKNEPTTPDSSDLIGELADTVISAVNGVKKLIMTVLSKIIYLVKEIGWGILWLIILLLRGLFAVISLLLTFVRGVLGKWAELIASVFEWFREAVGGKFSALTSDAFTTSSGVLNDSGSPPLFDFPYRQEIDLSRRVKSAAEEYSKQPVWVDQAKQGISALFKSGYDEYYPAQVQATRAFFFNLCQQTLNRNNLEKPCLDSNDESARIGLLVLDAQSSLKRQVANYQRALDDAGKDSSGFAAGFWAELKDSRGFNALDLDIIISWVGWGSALAFRFTGCILAIAGVFSLLFTAPAAAVAAPVAAGVFGLEAVTVLGLFKAADFVDFITSSSRTILGLVSYYPYATAYPRDAVLMPALFYAMGFRPADTRFNASDVNSIIGESHIDLGY
jgi:hypothetical protein